MTTINQNQNTLSEVPQDQDLGGDPNAGKVFISYVVLGVFFGVFIIGTVGLGLIVSLVNNPECTNNKGLDAAPVERIKRDLFGKKDQISILKDLTNLPKVAPKEEYPRCDELNGSPDLYPWGTNRLPNNIAPNRYELTLRTPIFSTTFYNGEITITFTVREQTSYIVLNARFLSTYTPSLKDELGNDVQINCIGDFTPSDYFVIKTTNPLAIGQYSVDLFFTGSLVAFSNGLFDVKYNNTDDEFQG